MIEGIYKKTIFSSDNGYIVGLLKVTEYDDNTLCGKTITFTGYFTDINLEDNLKLTGEFIEHHKYGSQFNVTSYEIIMPTSENSIISFLSSGIFKGIGESKAKRIYDSLGDDAINMITNDINSLVGIKGITKKNREDIYNTLLEYQDSIDIIVKLNEFGFNNRDSNSLYNKYKKKVIDVIENNIYDVIDDNFPFKKIDSLALKLDYIKDDKRRVEASIIYILNEVINTIGDTYLISDEIYNYLTRLLSIYLDGDVYNEVLNNLVLTNKLILDDNKYYLKKMFDAETNIARRLTYLETLPDNKYKKLEDLLKKNELDSKLDYNLEQEDAIRNSFIKNFLVITGGPGTGKTTIIKSIVDIYCDLFKLSHEELCEKVILLAPTGRASKRITETVHMPASTIHRFLKWNKDNNSFGVNEKNKVDCELVIIDEASMIDTYLFDSLLKGLKFNTKIIMVGDVNQLPSVSAGQVLKDIINTDKFKVIYLKELYRQQENSNIISLAYNINNGINEDIYNKSDDLTFIECTNNKLINNFIELCETYKDYNYNDFIIMAPLYKTNFGIDNLNLIARDIFNPKKKNKNEITIGEVTYRENDKVLELVNMPDYNVFNGDLGIITRIDNINKEITVDYDGNIVIYNKSNYTNFTLGYVISIHKSQGSEYKVVLMVLLTTFRRMLYRKLLYTGVTRAKNNLYILGEMEAINMAIHNNASLDRKTGLKEKIIDRFEC